MKDISKGSLQRNYNIVFYLYHYYLLFLLFTINYLPFTRVNILFLINSIYLQ